MERRTFLIRGGQVLLTVPVGWAIADCGSGTTYGTPTTPATTNGLQFTSSVVNGHSHGFNIDMQDISQPPAAGISGDTTTAQAHVHTVSLSQAELVQIQGGQVVSKDTSAAIGHVHTFQFSLAAGAASGSGTSGGSTGGNSGSGTTTGSGGTTGGGTGTAGKPGGY